MRKVYSSPPLLNKIVLIGTILFLVASFALVFFGIRFLLKEVYFFAALLILISFLPAFLGRYGLILLKYSKVQIYLDEEGLIIEDSKFRNHYRWSDNLLLKDSPAMQILQIFDGNNRRILAIDHMIPSFDRMYKTIYKKVKRGGRADENKIPAYYRSPEYAKHKKKMEKIFGFILMAYMVISYFLILQYYVEFNQPYLFSYKYMWPLGLILAVIWTFFYSQVRPPGKRLKIYIAYQLMTLPLFIILSVGYVLFLNANLGESHPVRLQGEITRISKSDDIITIYEPAVGREMKFKVSGKKAETYAEGDLFKLDMKRGYFGLYYR